MSTNPLQKMLGVDKYFLEFDVISKKKGFFNACKWLIDKLAINYQTNFKVPKGGLIITSNHPTGIDPYLLTAALGRRDMYFWGDLYQSKKGKNIAKNIIKIAPKPFWSILRRPLTNWPGYIYMRITTPSLPTSMTQLINRKAIQKTLSLLKRGKSIIIFPSGGEYEFLRKGRGFEIVTNKAKDQGIKCQVLDLKIKNFGELHLFSHFIFGSKINAIIEKR